VGGGVRSVSGALSIADAFGLGLQPVDLDLDPLRLAPLLLAATPLVLSRARVDLLGQVAVLLELDLQPLDLGADLPGALMSVPEPPPDLRQLGLGTPRGQRGPELFADLLGELIRTPSGRRSSRHSGARS
jgi:hypothetical protein